jgi:hypothetical protein
MTTKPTTPNSADRIATLEAALEEITAAVDAYNANHGRYPTQRINNASKSARFALNKDQAE